MSSFEMEFELSGLKIKIKSDRDQAPQALQSVQQQIGSLLQAASGLGTGEATGQHDGPTGVDQPRTTAKVIEALPVSEASPGPRSKGGKRKRAAAPSGGTPVEFSHAAATHGSPKQTWNTAQKSMWLIYILEKQTSVKEYTTSTIAATFNKHFKEFGAITTTNVTRDLGAARVRSSFVSSDASKDPQTWYLLQAGKEEVERLIAAPSTGGGKKK